MSTKKNIDITDRLKLLVNDLESGNQKRFADNCNIPVGTFNRYINGRLPNLEYLIPIWKTYNVNLHWLITGEGDIYFTKPDSLITREEFESELSSLRDEIKNLKGDSNFHKKGNAA